MSYEVMRRKRAESNSVSSTGTRHATVNGLASNPRPLGAEHVVSMPGVLRVGNGDYWLLYSVDGDDDDDGGRVWIEDVKYRIEAYGGH